MQQSELTKWRHLSSLISLSMVLLSLVVMVAKGFNWGLDFTGGVIAEVAVKPQIGASDIQSVMNTASKQDVSVIAADEPGRWVIRYGLPDNVQNVNSSQSNTPVLDIKQLLSQLDSNVKLINTSVVGPQVGQGLAEQGGLAFLIAALCILGYLSYRFEWRLAAGALCALFHDVIFVLAFFSLSQMEFNLTVLAAILAILGYSLNDSIIIADRIRQLLIAKPDANTIDINNEAVLATFSRTMVTSGTTLMTIVALWIMGGESLAGFAIAMFIGVLTGTWSSISVGTVLPEKLGLLPEHYKEKPLPDSP